MEWNTVNDILVNWHTNAVGVVTGAPADDMVFVGNSGNSSVTMIKPGGASNRAYMKLLEVGLMHAHLHCSVRLGLGV